MKHSNLQATVCAGMVALLAATSSPAASTTNLHDNVTSNLATYAVSPGGGDQRWDIWTNGSVLNISSDIQMLPAAGASSTIILDGSQGYIGGSATYPIQVQNLGTSTFSLVNGSLLVVTNTAGHYVYLNSAGLGTLELMDSTMRIVGAGETDMYVDFNGGGSGVSSPGETWLRMQNSLLDVGIRALNVGHAGRLGAALLQDSVITNLTTLRVGASGANGAVTLSNSTLHAYRVNTSYYTMSIGGSAGRAGAVTLDQSTWTANGIYGYLGGSATTTGIVTLINGSTLDHSSLQLGVGRVGYGIVNITNSTFIVNKLDIGGWGSVLPSEAGGNGVVNNVGGTVRANQVYLGTTTGSQGAYNGTGSSVLVTPSLRVGHVANSTGAVVMASSSAVYVTNATKTATLHVGPAGKGTFTKNGGTLLVDHLSVGANGALVSASGEVWSVRGNFSNVSTNNTGFNLLGATLEFTGGGAHTLDVAGADLGGGVDEFGVTVSAINNFGLDALKLASAFDTLTLNDSNGGGGALYIRALLLPGNNTNLVSGISSVNGLNIYYRYDDTRSGYLNGLTYGLTGGGLLIGIPEPSVAVLWLAGALLLRGLNGMVHGRS